MTSWVASVVWDLAGWVGSTVGAAVVQKFVEEGIDSTLSEHTLLVDSEAALKRVQAALPQIRALMGVAEALKLEDPSCREWVEQFREAVDAAEDVMDELEYKKLEDMVQNPSDDQVAGSSSGSKKRKTTGAISADILERLKKAVTMLDEATAGVEGLLQRADRLGIRYLSETQFEVRLNLMRETTSLLAERKVFGRDDEKTQIIGWLKRETEAPLSSVGIVGVGGLGKTTLAQSVYQDLSGSGYFEKIIWVCVSTEFSVEGITKNILAGMGGGCRGDDPLDVLQQNLKEKIHSSKKVLLFLDDVWEDSKRGDWEKLVAPLRFAQQGSKILFTTRQQSVANLLASVINTERESLPLQNLEEKEMRSLFNSYAFCGSNPDQHGDLQEIGDQIVKKLHGNPLAAKVIGSLLNSRMDLLYWRRILSHGSLINLEQAKDIMDVLKLSYYNLPADLQVCFRFCSIFPQGYKFDKKELIEMWMACGFIQNQSCEERRPEDIGEDYFNLLLRKSFFEIDNHSWNGEKYVMHDLIHELAQNVSNGECCRVAPSDKSVAIPSTVRHVSVDEHEIQKVFHLENIRSLVITNFVNFVLPKNLVKKSLRLLKINAFGSYKLPEETSCLVHLRYLSIKLKNTSRSFKHLLPASIYKLYHLIVLEFKEHMDDSSYSGIKTTGMANLVSLRYMRLPDKIMKTICRVHRMTSLQELNFFVRKESGYRINELHTLNNLRSLTIHNIENIGDPAEARSANLLSKKNLKSLSLVCTEESNLDNLEEIFDNLQPHQNLMELVIENYNGQRSPLWITDMSPPNLSYLKLSGCPFLNKQPIFGQVPYLKFLYISNCPNLVQLPDMPLSLTEFRVDGVGLTSLPNFGINIPTLSSQKSSLKKMKIANCPNLISLNGFLEQGNLELQGLEELTIKNCENLAQLPMHAFRTIMSLKKFSIIYCPNLVQLPDMPLPLTQFLVVCVGLTSLPNFSINTATSSSQKSSLRTVEIENCPNLISWNGFLEQGSLELQGLEKLTIQNCGNLAQLPMHAFRTTISLKHFRIKGCPNLVQLPDMPLSLTEFVVCDVGLTSLPNFGVNTPTSSSQKSFLRIVEIRNCPNLISLNGFLEQGNLELQGLERIVIRCCANLAQLPMYAFKTSVSLKDFIITYCPNLVQLPDMPLPRSQFAVVCVGLTSLPNFSISTPTLSSQKSYFRIVRIANCPNLISWNEFLEEGNLELQGLTTLIIKSCENIAQLPMQAFRTIVSLEDLIIKDCPNLVQLPDMPLSLTQFRVDGVGLTSLPNFGVNTPTPSSQKLSLKTVEITNCPNLISWNGFLEQGSLELQDLEKLTIQNCGNLAQLPMHAFRTTISLKHFRISGCPNLVQLPDMPLSLAEFVVCDVGLTSLPNFGVNTPTSSSQKSFLIIIEIRNCPNLISLNGFLEQGNLELQGLENLTIDTCENLAQLPMHAFRTTISLKHFRIKGCPNLVQLPDIPLSLTNFVVCDVGLISLPNFDVNTPTSSSQKSSLRIVLIMTCPNLISLNGFLEQDNLELQGLEGIDIWSCENLAQLPIHAFRTTQSLKHFRIIGCPNLVQLPNMPLSLTRFLVEGVGLTSLPNFSVNTPTLSSQKSSLRTVDIGNCPNLISLNGFLEQGNLELQGLEKLTIHNCENLAQLPMHAFRTNVSLKYFSIIGCPNMVQLPDMPLSLTEFQGLVRAMDVAKQQYPHKVDNLECKHSAIKDQAC